MAEVIIKFNTKGKDLTVTMDGVAVENVYSAEVYRKSQYEYGYGYRESTDDEEKFSFCITQMEKDKENDTATMTRTVASAGETKTTKAALQAKATADIVDFFGKD